MEARVLLAFRRSARFARGWTITIGALIVVAMLVPLASTDPQAVERSRLARLAADTLRSAQRVRRADAARVQAESLLAEALRRPTASRSLAIEEPLSERPRLTHELSAAIEEARRLRTVATWLEVSERPEVSWGPRMRGLADTLRALAARRDSIPTGPQRDRQLADITQRIGRTGYTILAIAENRRLDLDAADPGASEAVVVRDQRPVTREALASRPDTTGLGASLRASRDSAIVARRTHDSLGVAIRALESALEGPTDSRWTAAGPAIALGTLLLLGLAVRFGSALSREVRAPALAHAREAESVSGAPVLATVRESLLDGPARFRPTGVDPFRMLYLGLTSTGTRARTALITGSDPVIAAAVGARLAIAAAADHRATLIVDLDPTEIAVARVLRERPEPGLTDALAGAFRWKEVARPIGSSDGLPITLLPAGSERADFTTGEARARVDEEFARFRSGFELTILVAPSHALELAVQLVGPSPLLLVSWVGETPIARFGDECAVLRAAGRRVTGIVLWDTAHPALPSRAELAALLSKRKGRTPGGSFEAVRRVIGNGGPKG